MHAPESIAADYALLVTLGCATAPTYWWFDHEQTWLDALNAEAARDGLAVEVIHLPDERLASFAVLASPTSAYDCARDDGGRADRPHASARGTGL